MNYFVLRMCAVCCISRKESVRQSMASIMYALGAASSYFYSNRFNALSFVFASSRHLYAFWVFHWIILRFVFAAAEQKKVFSCVCVWGRYERMSHMTSHSSMDMHAYTVNGSRAPVGLIKNSLSHTSYTHSSCVYRKLISVSELMCCIRVDGVRARVSVCERACGCCVFILPTRSSFTSALA